jgi:hypothetical protein
MWWKIRQTNIWHELRLLKQSCPLFAMQVLRGRGGTVPTHSWPRHYIRWMVSVTHRPRFTLGTGPPVSIG